MAESAILQNCFQLLPGKKFYDVRLTRENLFYQQTTIESCCKPSNDHLFNVKVSDIYGAKLFRSSVKEDDDAYIHIYTCPVRGNKRVRRKVRFNVSGWEDLESNIKRAEHWVKTISWLIRDPSIDTATLKGKNSLSNVLKSGILGQEIFKTVRQLIMMSNSDGELKQIR